MSRRRRVRHARAVAERPKTFALLDLQRRVDFDPPALVGGQTELGYQWIRADAGGPDERV